MKFLAALLCLFTFQFSLAQYGDFTMEREGDYPDTPLAKDMDKISKYLDKMENANDDIVRKCGEWEQFDKLSSCINEDFKDKLTKQYSEQISKNKWAYHPAYAPGVETLHCDDTAYGDEEEGKVYYCFNGMLIRDEGKRANFKMMEYLCSDEKLPVEGIEIAFGPCEYNQFIQTDEMECMCKAVNADKRNGLAWHCKIPKKNN